MTGSLGSLAIALALFIGIHMMPGVPGLRRTLRGAMGKLAYRGVFSLISIGAVVWIVFAHMDAPYEELWAAPGWTRLIPLAVMPLVLILLFGALALFALIDQPLADARIRREEPERWAEKFSGTSAIPFLAALQGNGRPSLKEIGYVRIVVALVLYVVILFAHEHVIGFSALPG